jgi:hypothetical protein
MQRKGRTHKAAMSSGSNVNIWDLLHFCEQAADDFKEIGEEDTAFYFDNMADYLRNGFNPGKGLDKPSKVLGM